MAQRVAWPSALLTSLLVVSGGNDVVVAFSPALTTDVGGVTTKSLVRPRPRSGRTRRSNVASTLTTHQQPAIESVVEFFRGSTSPGTRVESDFTSSDKYFLDGPGDVEVVSPPPNTSISKKKSAVELAKGLCEHGCKLVGIDTKKISSMGVGFALSYGILSVMNGAISLSMAWYISSIRTGLSPLAPGQWKSLLAAYGTLYTAIQVLKPVRVAAAIAMSKFSLGFLRWKQSKLNCSRGQAIAMQYSLGWLAWGCLTTIGVSYASVLSGVPIFG